MTKLKDMNIYIVTTDFEAVSALKEEFEDIKNVQIYNMDIR